MKIAQISSVFPPYRGGIGQVAYHYATELAKDGEAVEVLTVDYGEREMQTFPVHYLKAWFRWGKAGFCPQIFFKLSGYDVVQLHYPSFGLMEAALVWKWLHRRKKLIVFYHHDTVGAGLLGKVFKLYKLLFLPLLLSSADMVLVSSLDYAQNSDIGWFVRDSKHRVAALPFGADPVFRPAPRRAEFYGEFGLSADRKTVLFVGGMDRNHYFKGVDKLLRAVAKLQRIEWQLLLVGGGDLVPGYKDLSRSLGIADRVSFAGWQPDNRLPQFYQQADVFCLPSIDRSEAFGIVLIEAMACGVPVIASDLPGVRSVVDDGQNGLLVPPGDISGLTNAIERLLGNDEQRRSLGTNGQHLVERQYRWPEIVRALSAFYRI